MYKYVYRRAVNGDTPHTIAHLPACFTVAARIFLLKKFSYFHYTSKRPL